MCLHVAAQSYTVSTYAGLKAPVNIPATSASIGSTSGVAVDSSGNVYFTANNLVLRMDGATHVLTLAAGGGTQSPGDNGPATAAQLNTPVALAFDSAGNLYIAEAGASAR